MSKKITAVALAALTLAASACSQGGNSSGTSGSAAAANQPSAAVSTPSKPMPTPFSKGNVHVAIVQQTGQGDYFQQYLNGTKKQAEALGMKLDVYDAQGDNATQASQLDQAIASGATGIIVRHGFADTLCPGVNKALDKGIKVVIYDVEIQKCAPRAVQTQQSDSKMAGLVLAQMLKDVGKNQNVGYVNVAGIAPLDRRDAVWQSAKKANNWTEKFKTGKYTASTATDTAPMVDNALKANSDVTAIYAPYDELTKATLSALEQNPNRKGKVSVYGADISTADIELMTANGSPWKATGATDPNAIGAAVTRTLALDMAGQLTTKNVEFPPILVTAEMLKARGIKNMDDLRKAEPALNISDTSSADWIPKVTF
ncbi:substrate-binding domain-containing protein [Acidipropionibacterium timonense]|uniref:substrate-binding domain-containing protein n=1 Tax=Acidipropionibacterium timonense TaxID=2161818 RepID=UPI0010319E9E|nr:substrate-binding domain-containing protein [Acidipropionibacterium timonense]